MSDHGHFSSYEGHKERRTGKIRGALMAQLVVLMSGGSDVWATNKRHIGLYFGVTFCFQDAGRGGPYEKLAALPAANVRVSDIQHVFQPYISRRRVTRGNMGRIYVFISS